MKLENFDKDNVKIFENKIVEKILKLKGKLDFRIENAIDLLKSYEEDEINSIISNLELTYKLEDKQEDRVFLTWEEVREMAQSGLISFGSHTSNHLILTNYNSEEIQKELTESRKKILEENIVDPEFITFCYPNGNYNAKIAEMVKNAGYHLAVTTKQGWNSYDADPYTLNRHNG